VKHRFGAIVACALALLLGACATKEGGVDGFFDALASVDLGEKSLSTEPAEIQPKASNSTREVIIDHPVLSVPSDKTQVNLLPDGRYEVELLDAPIVEAAKSLFADVLQQPYSIDPRAQGSITLSTGGPVGRKELLAIFEAALTMNDLALIWDGTQFRITLVAVQLEGSPAGQYNSAGSAVEAGAGITALPLKYVKAESLIPVLEGFAARGGALRAINSGNILFIRGTAAERRDLTEIAKSLDVNALASGSFGMSLLGAAQSRQVLAELRRLQSEIDPDGTIRFVEVSRANGILVIARDRAQLQTGLDWVHRLSELVDEANGAYVYRVQFGNPTELAGMLSSTFGDSVTSAEVPMSEAEDRAGLPAAQPMVTDSNSGKLTLPVQSRQKETMAEDVSVSNAASDAPASSDGAIRFTPSDNDNTIVIRAPGHIYRQALALLENVDKPPTQVMINVILVEVALNDKLNYGVQTYLEGSKIGFISGSALPIATQIPGANLVIGAVNNPDAILNALKRVTTVKVVSSPSVVALDNETAVIKVGEQVPITTQQVINTTTIDAPVVSAIEYRDAGMILRVHPRISSRGLVTLKINQELSAVVGNSDGTTTLTPVLKQRSISSTVSVNDQQTVVLGGLISNQESKDRQGLPFIERIPLLGNVLGQTNNSASRTELVVFITPKVIRDGRDASVVSRELRDALSTLAN
jgi:general secretion pathway protein D